MASTRIKDLTALDWDDTALIKAYNKGMSLREEDFENCETDSKSYSKNDEYSRGRTSRRMLQWAAGDYCRAVNPSDDLVYEATVVSVSDDKCTVNFLGLNEEAEVDADTLAKSEVVRKKQIKHTKEYCPDTSAGQWAAGDYCRAVYPSDNLVYEAKVVCVSGDKCTVDFLGYNEEAEVDTDTLSKSKGKAARKKQIKQAKEYYAAEESASGDDYSSIQSPYRQKREHAHMNHTRHVDHLGDRTAAESTFQHSMYPAPPYNGIQPAAQAMMPPPPPMLHGADVAQNPSLCAMLSSWYMAGYYTGLHQAQKGQCHQRCCCRPAQNYCHY